MADQTFTPDPKALEIMRRVQVDPQHSKRVADDTVRALNSLSEYDAGPEPSPQPQL
jgi:hypothetical protein